VDVLSCWRRIYVVPVVGVADDDDDDDDDNDDLARVMD
jgi:hypothetical protein